MRETISNRGARRRGLVLLCGAALAAAPFVVASCSSSASSNPPTSRLPGTTALGAPTTTEVNGVPASTGAGSTPTVFKQPAPTTQATVPST